MYRLFIFVAFTLFISNNSLAQKTDITINVHPGIELLTIIQKLADQFQPSTPSLYEKEVNDYFGKFKNLNAVTRIKNFKGNVYPDLTELGFCFSDFPEFKLHIPDSLNWYKYYGKDSVEQYLKDCKDFAEQTNFWEFYKKNESNYLIWGKPIYNGLIKDSLIEKLNDFYKTSEKAPKFYICIDPLNGWGAHAINNPALLNPDYADLKAYTIGYFSNSPSISKNPIFAYGNYAINLVWHEGSHVYLEQLFKKYEAQIEALSYLFNKDDQGMKSQNISNWNYCLNENVVRGIVIALFKKYKTEREWKRQNAQEILNDFIYSEEISKIILDNYLNNNKYENFADFFPVLLDKIKLLHPKSH